jgi:hypothetical protein
VESCKYDNDNSHLAVITQANVQDVLWLNTAAGDIARIRFPAYFIQLNPDLDTSIQGTRFYAVVSLTEYFRKLHNEAWRRLARNRTFRLNLFESADHGVEATASW